MKSRSAFPLFSVSTALWLLTTVAAPLQAEDVEVFHSPGGLNFTALGHAGGQILVTGGGLSVRRSFSPGESLFFDAADDQGNPLPDGIYRYELTLTSSDMAADLQATEQARVSGDDAAYSELTERVQSGDYPRLSRAGQFQVVHGLVSEYDEEIAAEEEAAEVENSESFIEPSAEQQSEHSHPH